MACLSVGMNRSIRQGDLCFILILLDVLAGLLRSALPCDVTLVAPKATARWSSSSLGQSFPRRQQSGRARVFIFAARVCSLVYGDLKKGFALLRGRSTARVSKSLDENQTHFAKHLTITQPPAAGATDSDCVGVGTLDAKLHHNHCTHSLLAH